jgi:hypothetical protein
LREPARNSSWKALEFRITRADLRHGSR